MFSQEISDRSELLRYDFFLILGGGISGDSAARLLKKYNKTVYLADRKQTNPPDSPYSLVFSDENIQEATANIQCVIKSPGISPTHPILASAKSKKIPILSEIALGRIFYQGKLVGITGTDGKSTTTALTHHILSSEYPNAVVGGNLGRPFTDFCDQNADLVVLELSSYQLEDSPNLNLTVSAITNLAPDHLERHKTMENYLAAKWKVADLENPNHCFLTQRKIWNRIEEKKSTYPGKVIFFGENLDDGIRIDPVKRLISTSKDTYETNSFPLPGNHNLQNLAVAIGIAEVLHVPKEKIISRFSDFEGLPHRFKKLKTSEHPLFPKLTVINDSKSTNLHSMLSGLSGFSHQDKVYLILGGEPKEESLDPFFARWKEIDCEVWVYGKAAEVWKQNFQTNGNDRFHLVPRVEEALRQIKTILISETKDKLTSQNRTLLFSPACASFDLYKNFTERGEDFERCVKELFLS